MFYQNQTDFSCQDTSECLISGTCSVNPSFTSSQEILILYLKELAFYLLKLKSFGVTNRGIRDNIIDIFFGIVLSVNYNDENFSSIILKLTKYIEQSKSMYEKFCCENGKDLEIPPFNFKHLKNYNLATASIKGEKYFLKKIMHFDETKKGYYNIITFLCKGLIIKIVEMQRLGGYYDEAYYKFLELLSVINVRKFDLVKIDELINQSLDVYYDINDSLYTLKEQLYGKPEISEVSFSSKEGKAILVSGTDIKKLENVLEAVKDKEINVYTHGFDMLMAHAYPKFKSYKNLCGHFGSGLESCIVDFASFPGAILLTKGSLSNIEYLYKGRLFTLDPLPSTGVTKIVNNDYTKLINDALLAKGFKHNHKKPSHNVGFNEEKELKVFDGIFDRLVNKDIKHLFIIGLNNSLQKIDDYYSEFFENLPNDCFAISLAFDVKKDNVYHINTVCDYLLLHKFLKIINEKGGLKDVNISVFITKPDKQILFNLLYLSHIGVKNIYTGEIPISLILPSITNVLNEKHNFKKISNAQIDIENILNS